MESKKTTIIIPAFIQTRADLDYLGECLESSVPQAPVIVANDGSPVDLSWVARQFSSVTFLDGAHIGKSAARNRAAQYAQTDLLYPLDADDKIESNAIAVLERTWRGVPVYSDLLKWYNDGNNKVHELQAFSCQHVTGVFGMSSVNVLHSKEQWATVGGWATAFNLYEDWLYNAKLFWLFCGHHLARPLVYYRQHPAQSTQTAKNEGVIRREIRRLIEIFTKEHDMACCGKKRRKEKAAVAASTRTPPTAFTSAVATKAMQPTGGRYGAQSPLPAADSGRIVTARYIGGKGRGSHTYRGMETRTAYRVKNGLTLQVDIADTTTQADHDGGRSRSQLIRATPAPPAPPPPPPPPPVVTTPEAPVDPVIAIPEAPSTDMLIAEDFAPLPNTIRALNEAIRAGITREQARVWLEAENGKEKPRLTALKALEKVIDG